jgi:hypothetical protein
MLQKEKDLQLAIYSYLADLSNAVPTAYFIINRAVLISYPSVLFPKTLHVTLEKDGIMITQQALEKIKNAYLLRKSEIEQGLVEVGTGYDYEDLEKNTDIWKAAPDGIGFPKIYTSEQNGERVKPVNPYSIYNTFTPVK